MEQIDGHPSFAALMTKINEIIHWINATNDLLLKMGQDITTLENLK